MRDYTELDVAVEDDVFRIAFDDPDHYNPISPEVHEELSFVFRDAARSDARVVVLTGNGDSFSSGGDLDRMEDRLGDETSFDIPLDQGLRLYDDILTCPQPIVARVNGHAIGAGATFALICDIVVASEDAKIGDTHVAAGLVAGDGGQAILPLLTSFNGAKEMLLRGEVLTAEEAAERGLVNHVVPPADLDEATEEVVHDLASGPQKAIQYTKLTTNAWLKFAMNMTLLPGLALSGKARMESDDHEAAVRAFLEDREPNFPSGRDPDE